MVPSVDASGHGQISGRFQVTVWTKPTQRGRALLLFLEEVIMKQVIQDFKAGELSRTLALLRGASLVVKVPATFIVNAGYLPKDQRVEPR
jgi:hypothetical protein